MEALEGWGGDFGPSPSDTDYDIADIGVEEESHLIEDGHGHDTSKITDEDLTNAVSEKITSFGDYVVLFSLVLIAIVFIIKADLLLFIGAAGLMLAQLARIIVLRLDDDDEDVVENEQEYLANKRLFMIRDLENYIDSIVMSPEATTELRKFLTKYKSDNIKRLYSFVDNEMPVASEKMFLDCYNAALTEIDKVSNGAGS